MEEEDEVTTIDDTVAEVVTISREILTSTNYETWKHTMKNYLTHKKLWHCVIEQDPTNSSLDDNVALSTIQYSISPELLPHIMYAQNAQQAW
ncbi:hypothetical protein MKW92_026057, partial [Papaver armeniacum]